jgi:hypothetical protein
MSTEVAARGAIAYIRAHYDEAIFPPRPKGPHSEVYDSEFAACARLICDNILREFERRLAEEEEEVEEVEVTTKEATVAVPPKLMRRSGAKNVSSPHLQAAFIDEARFSMGQPSRNNVQALVGKRVRLVFNDDHPPMTGVLTDLIHHPTKPLVVLDDDDRLIYPLNSIQAIEEA